MHEGNRMPVIDVRSASSASWMMNQNYYPGEMLQSIPTSESAVVGNDREDSESIKDSEWMDTLFDCPPTSDTASNMDGASQDGMFKPRFATSKVNSIACHNDNPSQVFATNPAPSFSEWEECDGSDNCLPVHAETTAARGYSGSLLKAAMNGGHVSYSSCVSLHSGESLAAPNQWCRRPRTCNDEMPLLLRMITNVASNTTHDGLLKLKGNVQPA